MLSDPLLTGISRQELDALAASLAPAQAAQTEQRCYQQRGGPRRKAAGTHGRPLLCDADRVLVTIVSLRQICSQKVLSDLIEVNPFSIGQAIAETRQLLDEHRHTVTPPPSASPASKPFSTSSTTAPPSGVRSCPKSCPTHP